MHKETRTTHIFIMRDFNIGGIDGAAAAGIRFMVRGI
jgi:hypothetical protein